MIILGVDPGTVVLGYGVVRLDGKKLECLALDAIKLNTKKDPFERLRDIHEAVAELFVQYQPDFLAMEAPFFGKNVQSMLKLGRAQGVIMSADSPKAFQSMNIRPEKSSSPSPATAPPARSKSVPCCKASTALKTSQNSWMPPTASPSPPATPTRFNRLYP